jgi:hypothetical protein
MIRTAALLGGLLAACQLICLPSSFAQTSADVAAQWGLPGTWQPQCGGARNDENPIYVFSVRGVQVVLDRDFGGDRRDSQTLVNVRLEASGTIAFTVPFLTVAPPQTREHLWTKTKDNSGIRILTNRDADTGRYVVRDGKFIADGSDTGWFSRCS